MASIAWASIAWGCVAGLAAWTLLEYAIHY
jgi:hypothetical protein